MNKSFTIINKVFLLAVVLLASYMVIQGGNTSSSLALGAYTVGFGILVVTGIMMIILGYASLDSRVVVVLAALIPLGISLGMVNQFFPQYTTGYSLFCAAGIFAIGLSRFLKNVRAAALILAFFHGISGFVIFVLPVILQAEAAAPTAFLWVSLGGLIMGIGGLFHLYARTRKTTEKSASMALILPSLLLVSTAAFVIGFTGI